MTADLEPAAQRMAQLIAGLSADQLDRPTPCPAYCLGDLLDHLATFALVFTAAATKSSSELGDRPPPGDASRLADDWQDRIPRDLVGMANAWGNSGAWEGTTRIGGGDTPGEVAGQIGLEELVVHGWDLARASGQEYRPDRVSLEGARSALLLFQKPGKDVEPGSPFGKVVEVPDDAALLDQVIGLSGRNPAWAPA
ncbi:MAG: TIGR03086 family metal-binding protein [Acidimicrobiia bacterium]